MQKFHSVVWQEDDWFVAKALEIELASQGKTEKEALNNLQEALELYFEDSSRIELAQISRPRLQDLSIQIHA